MGGEGGEERERAREREREREHNIDRLPLYVPQLGTKHTTFLLVYKMTLQPAEPPARTALTF